MSCSVCKKVRDTLHPRKSSLVAGIQLWLCTECKEQGREPRHLIIMHGRQNGISSVSDYLTKKKYCGDAIEAKDFV